MACWIGRVFYVMRLEPDYLTDYPGERGPVDPTTTHPTLVTCLFEYEPEASPLR